MKPVVKEIVEAKKKKFDLPIIKRNAYLLEAHMQRLHHLLSPELREALDDLLRHSDKVTNSMIEIAGMREFQVATYELINFRRCLIQGLDCKPNQLMQVPHMTEEECRHIFPGST